MYINFLEDRKLLGYEMYKDIKCGIKLVRITGNIFISVKTFLFKVDKKTFIILSLGIFIFFIDFEPANASNNNSIPTQMEKLSKVNLRHEDTKLIESLLSKSNQSDLDTPSVNKVLTRTGDIFVSTALNQDLLLVLSQLEKPLNPDVLKVSSNDIISLVKILKLNGINRKIFKDIYLKLFLILKLLIYRLVKQMNFSHLKQ